MESARSLMRVVQHSRFRLWAAAGAARTYVPLTRSINVFSEEHCQPTPQGSVLLRPFSTALEKMIGVGVCAAGRFAHCRIRVLTHCAHYWHINNQDLLQWSTMLAFYHNIMTLHKNNSSGRERAPLGGNTLCNACVTNAWERVRMSGVVGSAASQWLFAQLRPFFHVCPTSSRASPCIQTPNDRVSDPPCFACVSLHVFAFIQVHETCHAQENTL
jgi:hypothetical protein